MKKLTLFFATGFCSGYMPVIPGTFGTLVAFVISFAVYYFFPNYFVLINALILAAAFLPSFIIANAAEKHFNEKDASQIVIDEMIGFWVSILAQPFSLSMMILAFILFRFFDILKPFPVCSVQRFKGGVGIMADDIIAGLYVNVILTLLTIQSAYTGFTIL